MFPYSRSASSAISALAFGVLAFAMPASAQSQVSPPSSDTVKLKEMKIGKAVYGTDGIKIGEINRIKAEADGRVTELQVTTGGPAGLNADVIAITPDKIVSADSSGTALKLSLSAADAKKLPVLGDDQKG